MPRRAVFIPYQPKTILNKSKRADHWFWTRYSAYPYLGCQHGCAFCYCRERKFCPFDDPGDFAYQIQVQGKCRRAAAPGAVSPAAGCALHRRLPAGRAQVPLSRRMLEVCAELGFPVFVLTRSALVLRDLDLLQEIQRKARAVVGFSIITTPESPQAELVGALEGLAPPAGKRFDAMQVLAQAGIAAGTVMMPILPGLCDGDANLEAVVRWTADHGGGFVLAGGLTLADQQKEHFLDVLRARAPEQEALYQRLYPPASYGAQGWPWPRIARRIRELCARHGVADRQPRPVIPGEKRWLNKRVVERLANQAYWLEIDEAPAAQSWAYRKAAWAIEDLEQDIGQVLAQMGRCGLESIPEVGERMAGVIERVVQEVKVTR